MKRGGIINPALAAALARLRHTDLFVIADSGLPAPAETPVIDLAVVYGVPSFETVLRAIIAEIVVESAVVSEPITERNSACLALISTCVPSVERISHEAFKARTSRAAFIVRTGEATPYANVIFGAGVPF